MIVFLIFCRSVQKPRTMHGWQGKEEGQEGEELDERSFKVGLCPTSDMYVFVNTFNLKEMFSVELFYCFTVVLQCLNVVLQRFTIVLLCGFTGVLLSVGFRVLIGGITPMKEKKLFSYGSVQTSKSHIYHI